MLAAGAGAVLSGASAGWWWGLIDELPTTITVSVPRARSPRGGHGLTIARRDLHPAEIVHRRGVAVISLALATLETAVELGGEDGGRMFDRALQRSVRIDDVRRAYGRALGRRGSAEMARLLVLASDRAASELERRMVRLLRDAGIDGWEVNAPLLLGDELLVDVAFRAARVAVELKGWAYHHDPATLQADADRENLLQLAGWIVITLTWWDVTLRPRESLARITAALAAHAVADAA